MVSSAGFKVRLQKYMACCGIASRRKCESMIAQGRVSINGKVAEQPYIMVNPGLDEVTVDNRKIFENDKKVYLILNKPRGVITSASDPFGRATVLTLIGRQYERVYPVGRLDLDTEGLLLLTNDGELAFKLTHPRSQIEKEYYVKVQGHPNEQQLRMLREGVDIGDCTTSPAIVEKLHAERDHTIFKMVIKEGKKRQIRRMFETIGHPVVFLKRERVGRITIGSLKPGQSRLLSLEEIKILKEL